MGRGERVGVYVCGITPYDATHLGHAATYVAFDVVVRALRDAGHAVTYVQNVTDVDDPLIERAVHTGVDWADLAASETALFRVDMEALRVIPPDAYVGVVESVDRIAEDVVALLDTGHAYTVAVPDGPGEDVYLDIACCPRFGSVSGWTRAEMLAVWVERGGDPERVGKRDPLDPLLWRATRPGEPRWPHPRLGEGRPGWHIECTSIALDRLTVPFDIQGGGSDLIFPHHEMSAAQAEALTGRTPYAEAYVHQGMVGFEGSKMSKSKGNLVLVSRLREDGVDPMAIRLVLLAHHYAEDWEYTDDQLERAGERLATWRSAFDRDAGPDASPVVAALRAAVADDLSTPRALEIIDRWASKPGASPTAPGAVASAVDTLLGVHG